MHRFGEVRNLSKTRHDPAIFHRQLRDLNLEEMISKITHHHFFIKAGRHEPSQHDEAPYVSLQVLYLTLRQKHTPIAFRTCDTTLLL